MKRREFLEASCIAGAVLPMSAIGTTINQEGETNQEFYEIRKYHLVNNSKQKQFNDFLKNAAVPALNRLGMNPVGVFTGVYGPSSSTFYVLRTYKSLDSIVPLALRLSADAGYQQAGASLNNAPITEPGFARFESSLLLAFKNMPKLSVPPAASTRIFELRIYESHSLKAAKKKIEMFNEGGEIEIFKKTGLNPVFFGETIIGPQMPNLTYMLCFEDMSARDKAWGVFHGNPEWKKLSADPQYANTVSNITDVILRPTPYSQI
jgi:hypothetical protein